MKFSYNLQHGWMNLEDIRLSEISQTQRTNNVWSHIYKVSRIGKVMETDSRIGLPGAGEGGNWELLLMGSEFPFGVIKEILEMDGGDGTLWMYLMPLNCMLRNR